MRGDLDDSDPTHQQHLYGRGYGRREESQ
jgi:hypothetical protein